ncbi:DUF4127 family protein [Leifsonia sp. NPDC080035]|uniref:DUF4127 family protein n=1 Tax=Leifsonia sp. NPDC080035 TaxID=3143936 RepID=A0AAU7GBA6_9MICO
MAAGAAASRPRIALLPLDDRPVNVLLPQDVARVGGYSLDVPPERILPSYRQPGDIAELAAWLRERALDPATTHLVVSLDMLCYGGLIASRISEDATTVALAQLDVLRRLKRERPGLVISAVSLVMRASNSYSAAEEPGYWTSYGKELHALGGAVHRLDASSDDVSLSELTDVPAEIVSDFARRRVRNHIVNLTALTLVDEGAIDFLAVTADDTATHSAGSAEQQWLRHWMRFLPAGDTVLMYPGADEVGAALVARAIAQTAGARPSVRVSCREPGGLDRTPPYENVPLSESINRQLRASGASLAEAHAEADAVLVVHAPDPERHDMFGGHPDRHDANAVERTAAAVREELGRGNAVAVADVRYPNGADAELVRALGRAGALGELIAFGGWNTAGNTLGGVIATTVAALVGRGASDRDARRARSAVRQALLTRLLDDYAYQAVVRSEDGPALFPDHLPVADDEVVARAERAIADRLRDTLRDELPGEDWTLTSLRLPWRRSFEVELTLEPSER